MLFSSNQIKQWQTHLMRPVDSSSLAIFRILFGACMIAHAFYYHSVDVLFASYVVPSFFFSFPLFDWLHLKPLTDFEFYHVFTVMGLSAYCLLVGLFYRTAISILFVCLTYMYLLEKSYSPDPNYLYILITFLLILMKGNSTLSFDRLITKKGSSSDIANWNILLLRFQICVAYFYSGLAKLLHKDWLNARQLHKWLGELKHDSVVGEIVTQKWISYLFSYGGILFDLSIGFLLCFRRTRMFGFFFAIFFHLWNKYMLNLQVFPWVMLSTLVLFLDPDDPRKIFEKFKKRIGVSFKKPACINNPTRYKENKIVVVAIVVYMSVQILLPLRHFLYKGNVNWTHQGIRLAWHFMQNTYKSVIKVQYSKPKIDHCVDVQPINAWQTWWMAGTPDMIIQYVHYLKKELIRCGVNDPVIRVDSQIALNGRAFFPLIDSSANLANEQFPWFSKPDWVLPHPDDFGSSHHRGLRPEEGMIEVELKQKLIAYRIEM